MITHQGLTTCSLYKPAGVALLIMCIKVQSDDWLAASLATIAKHPGAMNSKAMRSLINAELNHRSQCASFAGATSHGVVQ